MASPATTYRTAGLDTATIVEFRRIQRQYQGHPSAFGDVGAYVADLAAEAAALARLFGCRAWWKLPAVQRFAEEERRRNGCTVEVAVGRLRLRLG